MSSSGRSGPAVRAYRRYIGPGTPNEARGYWLFVVGAILGVVGILVFLYSTTLDLNGGEPFDERQIAIVLSSLGLMLMMLGVVVRLPTNRRVTWVALLGAAVTLVATAVFVWAYPSDWDAGADYSVEIIAAYAVGIGLIVLSALVLPALTRTPEDVFEDLAPLKSASKATFELYRDRAEQWRWRLRHDNGNIIADGGEGYSSKQKARQGIESVRRNVPGADITELAGPEAASRATFEVYEGSDGDWYWRLRHDNGHVVADGAEGYASRSGIEEAIDRVRGFAGTADVLRMTDGAFDVYEDEAGEWRWRLLARNGRIIGDGGQGYASRTGVKTAVGRVRAVDDHEFEVYEDDAGRWRWRLVAANGEIVADSGQGYGSEGGATEAADRVREYAPRADLLSNDEGAFDLYKDDAGEWRWRLLAANGEIVADGGEGYSSRHAAYAGTESVRRNAPVSPIASR